MLVDKQPSTRGRLEAQRGQAFIETVLVGALLSLLLVMTFVLARQIDLRSAAKQAAHAFAMECAVRVNDCRDDPLISDAVANQIRARYFGAVEAPIVTGDRLKAAPNDVTLRPFWRNLDGQPLISRAEQIQLSSRGTSFDAGLKVATSRAVVSSKRPLGSLALEQAGPNRFGLDATEGLRISEAHLTGSFQLPPALNGDRPLNASFAFTARSAVLADAWAAQPDGTSLAPIEARIRSGSRLDTGREQLLEVGYTPVRSMLGLFGGFGLEPLARRFTPLPIDAAILPRDTGGPR